jgi:hypothetical protein
VPHVLSLPSTTCGSRPPVARLTDQERQVLALMAEGDGRGPFQQRDRPDAVVQAVRDLLDRAGARSLPGQ